MHPLPPSGSVLGVDVGYSPKRRSSAACRLDWTQESVTWTIRRFRAIAQEREDVLTAVAGDIPLRAAACDGPLRAGFEVIGCYRIAERMLTPRLQKKIGKPGQASAPVGKALNAAANSCANVIRTRCHLMPAAHAVSIDALAIVEAFPSAFLGMMIIDPMAVAARRGDRSDLFYQHLTVSGGLLALIKCLLPGRTPGLDLADVTNHDDRAALVCALTALCVAADDFVAVGDANGWIILPPRRMIRDWAISDLEANARSGQPGCLRMSDSAARN